MSAEGNGSIRKARSVHWAPDIEGGCPKPKPKRRHNRRRATLKKQPIIVVHRFGIAPQILATRAERIEEFERQPEVIQVCRCNRPLAITMTGILLFLAVAVACTLLSFYGKI